MTTVLLTSEIPSLPRAYGEYLFRASCPIERLRRCPFAHNYRSGAFDRPMNRLQISFVSWWLPVTLTQVTACPRRLSSDRYSA